MKAVISSHPIYRTWVYMKGRCYNKNNTAYPDYGGRGIIVCAEWVSDPKAFIDYVTSLDNYGKPGYTLDRKDNDGNYEPGNMRWADRHIQGTNQRISTNNTSGYSGVSRINKTGRYRAFLYKDRHQYHVGHYDTIEEAVLARNAYIEDNKLSHKLQKV